MLHGKIPYKNIDTDESIIEYLKSGKRLPKLEMADDATYECNFTLKNVLDLKQSRNAGRYYHSVSRHFSYLYCFICQFLYNFQL
jgi:hypothetical protein